jgi:hypothetical protein
MIYRGPEEERFKVKAMLLRANVCPVHVSPAVYRRLVFGAIALCAFAAPAYSETVVVECKISQRTINGTKTIYSDEEREQPGLRERFAFNVPKGRGCIVSGDACDETMGRLNVEQDESTITAKGQNPPVMLAYGFNRKAFFLLTGDDATFSDRDDCHEIHLDVAMP